MSKVQVTQIVTNDSVGPGSPDYDNLPVFLPPSPPNGVEI